MMNAVVAVVTRAPSAQGKSRLLEQLRTTDGVGLRSALLRDTLAVVSTIGANKAVLYTPSDAAAEIERVTPFNALFVAQRGATLGERMLNGASDLLARGFERVVLVGADLPTLPATYVADALERLAGPQESLVLGPAEDGGYYLIGMTRIYPELFDDVPWGTAKVLQRTREIAAAIQLRVELLPMWYDVDHPSDLQRVLHRGGDGDPTGRHTCAWLKEALKAI